MICTVVVLWFDEVILDHRCWVVVVVVVPCLGWSIGINLVVTQTLEPGSGSAILWLLLLWLLWLLWLRWLLWLLCLLWLL